MGEIREQQQHPEATWQALTQAGALLPETGAARVAAQMQSGGPWPEELQDTSVILDTDIGGDADDALALVVAARCLPQLKLVLTSDERHGDRAKFARLLLDELGRSDVAVVAGPTLSTADRYFSLHGLIPNSAAVPSGEVLEAVYRLAASTTQPLRWVGMGPMSNLALVVDKDPQLATRLRVTQMGGGPGYRDPQRAEHNIRLDVPAAHTVVHSATQGALALEFVTSEVTFHPHNEVSGTSPIYQALAAADAPRWATLLRTHMDQWFAAFHPGTMQHDALTLSVALQLPFVDSERTAITLDEYGRMHTAADGVPLWLSTSANYAAFMAWLSEKLDPTAVITGLARARG